MNIYTLFGWVSTVLGLLLVGVVAYLNVNHALEVEISVWSPVCIAIAALAFGSALAVPIAQLFQKLGHKGMAALVVVGILAGEICGFYLTAERVLASRAEKAQKLERDSLPFQHAKERRQKALEAATAADGQADAARAYKRCGAVCEAWEAKALAQRKLAAEAEAEMVTATVSKVAGSIVSILPASVNPIVAELIPALSLPLAVLILAYAFLAFPMALFEHNAREVVIVEEPPPDRRRDIPEDHPVVKALRTRGELTNNELADVLRVTKGEASKRRAEIRDHLIEARDGRTVRIRLAQ
jgi:hypothetical protein